MVKQVILCGCGNIGFRHLQALADIDTPARITIVEPFEGGHPRIADFIASEAAGGAEHYRLLSALPESREHFDLVVIATSADTRQAAFDSVVDHHDVGYIIFEKILFQTVTALDEVAAKLEHMGIAAFVNCGRRGFENYHALKTALAGGGPIDVTVTGSAFGLASNAVHFLDLCEFLNDTPLTSIDLSALQSGAVESKRAGFYEIFGTLAATLDNGAILSVTCLDSDKMEIGITLSQGVRSIAIDELGGTQSEDGVTTPFAIKHVSGMPYLYDNALREGDPGLTPYAASAHQHRLYLRAMCQHLDLPSSDDTVCPVS
ncbi:oxidoreductase family protein [Planktotalea frisia]|jgi:predicted dehydrogenase|uniref:Oxidoreductase family, NAD-binding Rossmann fold n=1 Tax=Planktotalea frisia TaxID=696762 RepID=A0A1L9NT29_9RHOB|nr:Gfo/Idh/MocA family oxidoreductase [Planktotalea frisia]OJI92455.1 oxidoreductase family, NAD-binding Rossmann fold [Planktotalea frisia]PZX23549.1 oxidoreductase family protein [Planktotalea frisia]